VGKPIIFVLTKDCPPSTGQGGLGPVIAPLIVVQAAGNPVTIAKTKIADIRPSPGTRLGIPWASAVAALLLFFSGSHALWLSSSVEAFQVSAGDIKVDGKPDAAWKYIAAYSSGSQSIGFFDYGKMVILTSDAARNNPDPSKYYKPKGDGSVSLLAAYDNTALYFFFLIKETEVFDGRTACKDTASWWKAHAAEVYVDYSTWDEQAYQSYFTADAGNVTFGTSKKSFQLDKAALPADTRKYFRDRTKNDRFQTRALPTGLEAVSAVHSSSDPHTIGVEMKIPFPTGYGVSFTAGKSMFISWGYNHYPDTGKSDCSSNPIAYRWAKHFKDYTDSTPKPPGWKANDSTHYDPVRSWDGWGRFVLQNRLADPAQCQADVSQKWDLSYWTQLCREIATGFLPKSTAPIPESSPMDGSRDLRGRKVERIPRSVLFPELP
jgi:hypothetical protein